MFTYPVGLLSPKGNLVPTNGLIGEWLFSNNLNDTSGQGNNGTSVGVEYITNRKGAANSAVKLSTPITPDTRINIGDIDIFEFSGDFSISLWVRPDGTPGTGYFFGRSNGSTSAASWTWRIGGLGASLIFGFANGSSSNIKTNIPANFQADTWKHIVIRATSTKFEFFSDGVYLSGNDLTRTITQCRQTTNNFTVGDNRGNFNMYHSVDDIRVYNRALTTDEITALYNE